MNTPEARAEIFARIKAATVQAGRDHHPIPAPVLQLLGQIGGPTVGEICTAYLAGLDLHETDRAAREWAEREAVRAQRRAEDIELGHQQENPTRPEGM